MTSITRICCIRVPVWFPCGNTSRYMTTHTSTNDLIMIHIIRSHRRPSSGADMTGFTHIRCIQMVDGFSTGNGTVMTIKTKAQNFTVW